MTPEDFAVLHGAAFTDSRHWSASEFHALLAHSGTFACGDPRAAALVRVIVDEAELLTLATAPAHRRRGLAGAVLAKAESHARDAGAATLFLEVAADNTGACALYAKSGYQETGRRPGYYHRGDRQPVAAILMSKDLRSA